MCFTGKAGPKSGGSAPPPQTLGAAGTMGDDSTLSSVGIPTSAGGASDLYMLGGANWQNTRNNKFRPGEWGSSDAGLFPGVADNGSTGGDGSGGGSGSGGGDSGGSGDF